MRTLIFTGRTYLRRFGRADGMTTDIEFVRGQATEVADANAARVMEIAADQFTDITPTDEPAAAPDDDAPSAGDTDTTPEED